MKRLYDYYREDIVKRMTEEFKYSNVHQVPKLIKISVNIGLGIAKENPAILKRAANDIYLITGQKPRICKAKKAISGFKLRQGDVVGLSLTLRSRKMYEFLEKLLNVGLPRVRDFRGVPVKSFDAQNNYCLAIKENIIFPEVTYERIEDIYGMQITFHIKAKTKNEAMSLLTNLGFPFRK
jgi:large subunit ribosomal protein L5